MISFSEISLFEKKRIKLHKSIEVMNSISNKTSEESIESNTNQKATWITLEIFFFFYYLMMLIFLVKKHRNHLEPVHLITLSFRCNDINFQQLHLWHVVTPHMVKNNRICFNISLLFSGFLNLAWFLLGCNIWRYQWIHLCNFWSCKLSWVDYQW